MNLKINEQNLGRPLLTLAIPTFNRLNCLRLLIDSVIKQMPNEGVLGKTFELLICNNASTDGTTEYLNSLANTKGIRVIHHAINCGATDNIIHCFEAAAGNFVWVMGDDDVPLVGAITAIMECLVREQPALMYLPSQWIKGELNEFAKKAIPSKNIKLADAMYMATQASVYFTFISAWIINKDLYLRHPDALIDRYRDTNLPQLEWYFSNLVNGDKFICAKDKWLIARAGNTGGYALFETFSVQYNRIVNEKLVGTPKLYRFFRNDMLWCFIPGLIRSSQENALGCFSELDKKKTVVILKTAYGNDLFFLFIVIPMIKLKTPFTWCFWLAARVLAKMWLYLWRKSSKPSSLLNKLM